MNTILIDMRRVKDKDALKYIGQKLDAPEWFGCNLDALFDILCDMHNTQITLKYCRNIKDGYAARVMKVFRAAAEENESLGIEIK